MCMTDFHVNPDNAFYCSSSSVTVEFSVWGHNCCQSLYATDFVSEWVWNGSSSLQHSIQVGVLVEENSGFSIHGKTSQSCKWAMFWSLCTSILTRISFREPDILTHFSQDILEPLWENVHPHHLAFWHLCLTPDVYFKSASRLWLMLQNNWLWDIRWWDDDDSSVHRQMNHTVC